MGSEVVKLRRYSMYREIAPVLLISVLASVYLVLGYSGLLGETWPKDDSDKVALFFVVAGFGMFGLEYLRQRAKRIGSQRARRQYAVAAVVAGIVWFALMIAAIAF